MKLSQWFCTTQWFWIKWYHRPSKRGFYQSIRITLLEIKSLLLLGRFLHELE